MAYNCNNDDFYDFWVYGMSNYDKPSTQDNNYLAVQTRLGNQQAFEELLNRNKRLIMSFSKRITNNRSMINELLQCGSIALYEATLTYDETRGDFIPYAGMFIRRHMNSCMGENYYGYRLPSKFYSKLVQFRQIENECLSNDCDLPDDSELKARLKVKDKTLILIKNYRSLEVLSLNEPSLLDQDKEFIDNYGHNNLEEETTQSSIDMMTLLRVLRKHLTPQAYFIIYNRFLISKPLTQTDIGKRLGLTKQAIQIAESKACKIAKTVITKFHIPEYVKINKLENSKIAPITPEMIIDYFYIRDLLTETEKKLYQVSIFGDYDYTLKEYAAHFELTEEEVQEMFDHIKQVLTEAKSYPNDECYQKFQLQMLEKKTKIYSLNLNKPLDIAVPFSNSIAITQ